MAYLTSRHFTEGHSGQASGTLLATDDCDPFWLPPGSAMQPWRGFPTIVLCSIGHLKMTLRSSSVSVSVFSMGPEHVWA